MHRLLVTLLVVVSAALAGCGGYINPLTGSSLSGGMPTTQSKLLGIRVPSGMDFYPEHSRLNGSEGMEILRGDASPALCASTVINGMQEQGWTARMGFATETRACYAYEKGGQLAVITIYPQSPTTMTLMTILVSFSAPAEMPIPITKKSSFSFGSSSNDSAPAPAEAASDGGYSSEPISTAPVSSDGGSGIVGRDI